MVLFPNAKINIGLNILRKREDGFHELETLFYPIGLKDALEYVENGGDKVNFWNSGLSLDIKPEQNLVLKAYRMLKEEHLLPGMDIHLHKMIPSGAGLGGGSSDAAFFIKSVNEYLELKISPAQLRTLAGRLGADCAFFLGNRPSYATGIGDELSSMDLSLKGYYLLLVKPPFGVDTKTAYSGFVPQEYSFDFKEILKGGIGGWKNKIKNDFETTIFIKFPELDILKNQLSAMGAAYISMSGSGSSVYAIFDQEPVVNAGVFSPGSFIWQEELN